MVQMTKVTHTWWNGMSVNCQGVVKHYKGWRMILLAVVLLRKVEWYVFVMNSRLVWEESQFRPGWIKDLDMVVSSSGDRVSVQTFSYVPLSNFFLTKRTSYALILFSYVPLSLFFPSHIR